MQNLGASQFSLLPIPNYIDGKVRTEIFISKLDRKISYTEQTSFSDKSDFSKLSEKDQAKVVERLKSLGYL